MSFADSLYLSPRPLVGGRKLGPGHRLSEILTRVLETETTSVGTH